MLSGECLECGLVQVEPIREPGTKGRNQACKVNGNQGWCQNWRRRFDKRVNGSGQRMEGRVSFSSGPVRMPWSYEMEAWKVDWAGNPRLNGGCYVTNKVHCPTVSGTSPFLDH